MRQTCANTLGEGCGRVLPVSEFHRKGRYADGSPRYTALCKACNREKLRVWRAHNPERVSAYNKRDRRVHRDARLESGRAYRLEHGDELRERARERYAANPEPRRAASAAWRAKNPEKAREKDRRNNARRKRPRS